MRSIVKGLGGSTRILVASIRSVNALSSLSSAKLNTFTIRCLPFDI